MIISWGECLRVFGGWTPPLPLLCFVEIQWLNVNRIGVCGYGYIHGYPRKNLWIWIWTWMGNFISTASLEFWQLITHQWSVNAACFTATTLNGCYRDSVYGFYFWTAGQRVDVTTESTFIWRVKSTDTYNETVSQMNYTNWNTGQPDYWYSRESCLNFMGKRTSYRWNDLPCNFAVCSVCELDI